MGSNFLDFSLPKISPLYSKMMIKNFFQKDEFLYRVPTKPFVCDVSDVTIEGKVKESLYFEKIS